MARDTHKDMEYGGNYGNSRTGAIGPKPGESMRQHDDFEAQDRVPYFPDLECIASAQGIGINARTYIGPKDAYASPRRIEKATPEGCDNLS